MSLGPQDIGLVLKPSSFDIDGDALETKIREYIGTWDERIQQEIEFLKTNQVGLVVSDIVPWAILAAKQAGVITTLVTNFTWVEIYQEYLPQDIINTFENCYRQVDHVLLYDLSTPYCRNFFKDATYVSLCARDFNHHTVTEIKSKFSKPIVFVSVGRFCRIKSRDGCFPFRL